MHDLKASSQMRFVMRIVNVITKGISALKKVIIANVFFRNETIMENRIFIMTYDKRYTCNPRYIAEELIRRNLPIEIIWSVLPGENTDMPPQITKVENGSIAMFKAQASAKIWLDNGINCVCYGMKKKSGQVYINTWHGSMGIKRLSGNGLWLYRAKRCGKETDYCISNSAFETDVYTNSFWPNAKKLEYGHPRNDIFFQTEKHGGVRSKVLRWYNLDQNARIALYAPTFRDDGRADCFSVDYERFCQALQTRFGGEWVALVRMHHKVRNVYEIPLTSHVRDAADYPDMQELMIAADVGLTDYSSWAYDYVLTRKPLFIYASDIEIYNTTRGFYYPLEQTPFPVCRNMVQLTEEIKTFDNTVYNALCENFLASMGCVESGNASKLVVDKIIEIMNLQ